MRYNYNASSVNRNTRASLTRCQLYESARVLDTGFNRKECNFTSTVKQPLGILSDKAMSYRFELSKPLGPLHIIV